jgi:hypothetical protein
MTRCSPPGVTSFPVLLDHAASLLELGRFEISSSAAAWASSLQTISARCWFLKAKSRRRWKTLTPFSKRSRRTAGATIQVGSRCSSDWRGKKWLVASIRMVGCLFVVSVGKSGLQVERRYDARQWIHKSSYALDRTWICQRDRRPPRSPQTLGRPPAPYARHTVTCSRNNSESCSGAARAFSHGDNTRCLHARQRGCSERRSEPNSMNKCSQVFPKTRKKLSIQRRTRCQLVDFTRLSGAPGQIRTGDPLLRRQTLYPTELRARCQP